MIMDTEHQALRTSLGALALGMLAADERWTVLQHADECPECNAELDDFLELAALLKPAAVRDLDPDQAREPEPTV
jgi:anti-sigma factor RsiW